MFKHSFFFFFLFPLEMYCLYHELNIHAKQKLKKRKKFSRILLASDRPFFLRCASLSLYSVVIFSSHLKWIYPFVLLSFLFSLPYRPFHFFRSLDSSLLSHVYVPVLFLLVSLMDSSFFRWMFPFCSHVYRS